MYGATKERLRGLFEGVREAVLSNLEEFTQLWIEKKAAMLNTK